MKQTTLNRYISTILMKSILFLFKSVLTMVLFPRMKKAIFVRITFSITVLLFIYYNFYCSIMDTLTTKVIPRLDELKIYTYGTLRASSSSKDLIVIMTPKASLKLVPRLKLLDFNFSDNFTTPLLIMHSNQPDEDYLMRLANTTRREMMFLDISSIFNLFPTNFDTCRTRSSYWRRGKWNYQLMIRFWFKILFELPQFKKYEYIMRLDDDSTILGIWINVFDEMRSKRAVYFANDQDADSEKTLPGTMKLPYIALRYIIVSNITVKQPKMIRYGFGDSHILSYFNNFEVMKLEFFRRQNVRQWIEEVDRTNGIFKYRWGDAPLRYITLAIFAEAHEILHRSQYNLSYCHKC